MKDIAILLQSRNRPQKFEKVVDMLYSTCYSKDNFDIIAFVDEDQKELYSYLAEKYTEIIWVHPVHQPGSWYNLITAQHDYVKNSSYYFFWTLIDDFWGLSKDWDTAILSRKNYFKDDIFTMHQSKEGCHGRYQGIFDNSYIVKNMSDGTSLLHHCELLPINTKRWVELMSPIFEGNNYTSQQELITASLVLLLKKRFNINRLVRCSLSWEDGHDSGDSNKIYNSKGEDRNTSFLRLSENWSDLEPIVDSMVKEITNE